MERGNKVSVPLSSTIKNCVYGFLNFSTQFHKVLFFQILESILLEFNTETQASILEIQQLQMTD